jgi:hypothetical protein
MFCRGEGSWVPDNRRLKSTDPKSVDKYVQRALVDDLMNYLDQDDRERGEEPPSSRVADYLTPDLVPQKRGKPKPEGTVTIEQWQDGLRPWELEGSIDDLDPEERFAKPVTVEQMVEGESEYRYGAYSTVESEIEKRDRDDSVLNYLDANYPHLMAYANGQTLREIAEDTGQQFNRVDRLVAKERNAFMRWLAENPNDPIVSKLTERMLK